MTTTKQKVTNKISTTKSIPTDSPISNIESSDLPANPFVFEILQLVNKQRSNIRKIEILKKFEHQSLKSIFIWNFDESIVSMLPPGEVPYDDLKDQNSFNGTLSDKIENAVSKMQELGSNSIGSQDQGFSSIRKEYQKLYNFVKGGNDSLSSIRRETMFINILRGLHPLEAEILCLCKDKKLETKYKITKELVSEAYPEIKWGGRS